MALIGVVSKSKETARELESALGRSGHTVRHFGDWGDWQAGRTGGQETPAMFVVDLDVAQDGGISQVRSLAEDPATALVPVLVASGRPSPSILAEACAFGAVGCLKRPFISVETVPGTESVLFSAHAQGQPR